MESSLIEEDFDRKLLEDCAEGFLCGSNQTDVVSSTQDINTIVGFGLGILVVALFSLLLFLSVMFCFHENNPINKRLRIRNRRKFIESRIIEKTVIKYPSTTGQEERSTKSSDIRSDCSVQMYPESLIKTLQNTKSDLIIPACPDDDDSSSTCGDFSCPICWETYAEGDRVCWSKNSQCNHVFHIDCIEQWLMKQHDHCPCCRLNYLAQEEVDSAASATEHHFPYNPNISAESSLADILREMYRMTSSAVRSSGDQFSTQGGHNNNSANNGANNDTAESSSPRRRHVEESPSLALLALERSSGDIESGRTEI